MKIIWKSFLKSVKTFMAHDPMTFAASLAFYTVISLPAILLLAINLLSVAYRKEGIEQDLLGKLNTYLGPNTVNQAEVILENASVDHNSLFAQIVGWGMLAFSATTVFISLQNGINHIWGVKVNSDAGILRLVLSRLLSFTVIVSIGFILMVSLALDSLLAIFQDWIVDLLNLENVSIVWLSNILLSMFVTSAVFTMVFKALPDVKTQWKSVITGGIFTAVFFLIGKFLIGYYLSTSDVGGAYGASGSLVVFLFWVYYSSTLVLFGAKFTYEYSVHHQENLESSPHASFVREEVITDRDKNLDEA